MSPLIVDKSLLAKVARVRSYADKHPYKPGPAVPIPALNPRHTLTTPLGHRIVYTVTEVHGRRFRHLSITVPGKLPNPVASWVLAEEFGFVGWRKTAAPALGWIVHVSPEDRSVIVAQEIPA